MNDDEIKTCPECGSSYITEHSICPPCYRRKRRSESKKTWMAPSGKIVPARGKGSAIRRRDRRRGNAN